MGPRILVTGALGQIGTELVDALEEKHGQGSVIATDVREGAGCRILDVMDAESILSLVSSEGITEIYHLAALLSATGERNPELCWKINVGGEAEWLAKIDSCIKRLSKPIFESE